MHYNVVQCIAFAEQPLKLQHTSLHYIPFVLAFLSPQDHNAQQAVKVTSVKKFIQAMQNDQATYVR